MRPAPRWQLSDEILPRIRGKRSRAVHVAAKRISGPVSPAPRRTELRNTLNEDLLSKLKSISSRPGLDGVRAFYNPRRLCCEVNVKVQLDHADVMGV